jgi:Dyp-type peroxidase family
MEGMSTQHRRVILGDSNGSRNAPDGWEWHSGEYYQVPDVDTVHVLLLIYADSKDLLEEKERELTSAPGLRVIESLPTRVLPEEKEHFGFRDGIAKPFIEGLDPKKEHDDAIRTGEIVLGYENFDGHYPGSPHLDGTQDPDGLLPAAPNARGKVDLGKNGTYLVMRQLEQDVAGFWQYVTRQTQTEDEAIDLAAKMVGRWPSGRPLAQAPRDDRGASTEGDNFGYARDYAGLRTPIGSHIRRSNPRDNLLFSPDESLKVVRHHRIVRRGRAYGPPIDQTMDTHGVIDASRKETASPERGLYFICLNADIERQFEFIQSGWLNSPKFGRLYEDTALAAGQENPGRGQTGGTFTVPGRPMRHAYHGFGNFVTVRGGAYFFVPGLRALRFIASENW